MYYPLHLAAAAGNTIALQALLEDTPPKEACRLILESANMTPLVGSGDEPTRYFYSPLFLAAYRGQSEAIEVWLHDCMQVLADYLNKLSS